MKVEVEIEAKGKEESEEFDKWEVQSACDCLIRAEEIKRNPELFKLVSEELDKKKKALAAVPTSIEELKKIAKKKIASDA